MMAPMYQLSPIFQAQQSCEICWSSCHWNETKNGPNCLNCLNSKETIKHITSKQTHRLGFFIQLYRNFKKHIMNKKWFIANLEVKLMSPDVKSWFFRITWRPPPFHCFNPPRSELGWIWSTNRRHLPTFCWDRNKPTAGDSCDWFQRDFTANKSLQHKMLFQPSNSGFHPGFQFIVSYRLPLEDWLGSHQSRQGGLQLWHLCAVFAPAHGVTGTDPEADCIACISNKGFSWKVQLSNQVISIKFMNQPLSLKKKMMYGMICDMWYMIHDMWYMIYLYNCLRSPH